MKPDDPVCLCFHVSRRKLENHARRCRPVVVSQMSQCGGAGTGCGWCIPILKQIFLRIREGGDTGLEGLAFEEHVQGRAGHIRDGKGTPPGTRQTVPDAGVEEGLGETPPGG